MTAPKVQMIGEFRKQVIKIQSLVRSAKESYFDKLTEADINISKYGKPLPGKRTAPPQPFLLTYLTRIS